MASPQQHLVRAAGRQQETAPGRQAFSEGKLEEWRRAGRQAGKGPLHSMTSNPTHTSPVSNHHLTTPPSNLQPTQAHLAAEEARNICPAPPSRSSPVSLTLLTGSQRVPWPRRCRPTRTTTNTCPVLCGVCLALRGVAALLGQQGAGSRCEQQESASRAINDARAGQLAR